MAAFPLRDIYYPESDGRPLGETERHRQEIVDLIYALDQRYRDDPGVYVGGDLFLYYAEGNPRAVVCPDVFVVFGVPKRPGERRCYKLWEEGRVPSLVVEVTSESCRTEDLEKRDTYARLGVAEYFLFDPLGEYLAPQLQGYRLAGDRYVPIKPSRDGSLPSRETGLLFQAEGARVRLVDVETGQKLLRTAEERGAREAAEAEALREKARAREERAAREAAEARAAAEASARRAAEEELTRLRRQLGYDS